MPQICGPKSQALPPSTSFPRRPGRKPPPWPRAEARLLAQGRRSSASRRPPLFPARRGRESFSLGWSSRQVRKSSRPPSPGRRGARARIAAFPPKLRRSGRRLGERGAGKAAGQVRAPWAHGRHRRAIPERRPRAPSAVAGGPAAAAAGFLCSRRLPACRGWEEPGRLSPPGPALPSPPPLPAWLRGVGGGGSMAWPSGPFSNAQLPRECGSVPRREKRSEWRQKPASPASPPRTLPTIPGTWPGQSPLACLPSSFACRPASLLSSGFGAGSIPPPRGARQLVARAGSWVAGGSRQHGRSPAPRSSPCAAAAAGSASFSSSRAARPHRIPGRPCPLPPPPIGFPRRSGGAPGPPHPLPSPGMEEFRRSPRAAARSSLRVLPGPASCAPATSRL